MMTYLRISPCHQKGSDLVTLAKEGRRVIGLELSPTAAARAKQTLEENKIPDELATVAVGDFFELHNDASVVGDKKFNLMYDAW
jgi:tRNA/tmRNA/rRNA uracil-C5-methylase (TrmA/RlmC/RlmD family)